MDITWEGCVCGGADVLILISKLEKKLGSQLLTNCSRLGFQDDVQKWQLYNIILLEKQALIKDHFCNCLQVLTGWIPSPTSTRKEEGGEDLCTALAQSKMWGNRDLAPKVKL